jgi:hypothetical protein
MITGSASDTADARMRAVGTRWFEGVVRRGDQHRCVTLDDAGGVVVTLVDAPHWSISLLCGVRTSFT